MSERRPPVSWRMSAGVQPRSTVQLFMPVSGLKNRLTRLERDSNLYQRNTKAAENFWNDTSEPTISGTVTNFRLRCTTTAGTASIVPGSVETETRSLQTYFTRPELRFLRETITCMKDSKTNCLTQHPSDGTSDAKHSA